MQLASHLHRSKYGVISIRLAVPLDLRAQLARRELKRSLNIRDSVIAQHWAIALTSRYGAHLEDFWDMVRRGYDPSQFDPKDMATWPSHKEDIGTYNVKLNLFTGEAEIHTDPNNPNDHRDAMEALKSVAHEHREALANPVILERLRLAQERDQAEREALMAESIAAMQATATKVALAATSTALSSASLTPKVSDPESEIRLSAAVEAYRVSLAGMNADTSKDYMFAVEWFERSIGPDTLVAKISHEQVANWKKELVQHYEAVREKKQATRVAKGHIRVDPIAGLPKETAKAGSVDKIIGRVHRFMMFCQRRRYFPRDADLPTKGLFLKTHYERKKASFYEQFDHHELASIFAPQNLLAQKKPHEFWMPILGLFTGARIGELSQIYHTDIYQNEDGLWSLAISDKEAFQTIKTNAGRRVIPIHPELIRLGFLDYVADVKAAVPESDRIFPYLRYDKRNGFGDVPSEAFARYLDKLGIYGETKVHHSFRKTSNQCLKDNGIEVSIRSQLVGHEKEGVNELIYAEDIKLGNLYQILKEKLVFPSLNFTPLKYVSGQFVEVLKSEMIAAAKRKRTRSTEDVSTIAGEMVEAEDSRIQTVVVNKSANGKTPLSQRMENRKAAVAAREARAAPKKRGRPRKVPAAT